MPKRRSRRTIQHRNPRLEEPHRIFEEPHGIFEEPVDAVEGDEPEVHVEHDDRVPLRNMAVGNRHYTPLGVIGGLLIVREEERENPTHRKIKLALGVLWLVTYLFMLAMGYYFYYGHLNRSKLPPLEVTPTPKPFVSTLTREEKMARLMEKILSGEFYDEEEFWA